MDRAPTDLSSLAALEAPMAPELLDQLRRVPLVPGRPLLVVDCDEVMVDFAGHLARFAAGIGIEMKLERYELEGAFREVETGRVLAFAEGIGIINRFFEAACRQQEALPGAADALARLSGTAQVVVLTNVPRHGKAARIENLAELGMGYPLIENSGGKGRALAWLQASVGAGVPAVFVDDSPSQIASAKRRAPSIKRIHFAGAPYVARLIPVCEDADHRAAGWQEAEPLIRRLLS